jgi:hypothetical protein
MINFSLNTILAGGSVILALIGLYFVILIWIKWRNINMDILKARVFLIKSSWKRTGDMLSFQVLH